MSEVPFVARLNCRHNHWTSFSFDEMKVKFGNKFEFSLINFHKLAPNLVFTVTCNKVELTLQKHNVFTVWFTSLPAVVSFSIIIIIIKGCFLSKWTFFGIGWPRARLSPFSFFSRRRGWPEALLKDRFGRSLGSSLAAEEAADCIKDLVLFKRVSV